MELRISLYQIHSDVLFILPQRNNNMAGWCFKSRMLIDSYVVFFFHLFVLMNGIRQLTIIAFGKCLLL